MHPNQEPVLPIRDVYPGSQIRIFLSRTPARSGLEKFPYKMLQRRTADVYKPKLGSSVEDPGYNPNPGSEFFHPGSQVKRHRISDPDPQQRILEF